MARTRTRLARHRPHVRKSTRTRVIGAARTAAATAAAQARQRLATLKAKARFLREFAQCGNVLRSAQAVKVGRRTVYVWLEDDEEFKKLYDQAHEDALDQLEEEARRRAVDGVLEPVYQGGVRVGLIRKYSDTLLITLLKGKRPETFRERFEHTGKDGGPIKAQMEQILKSAKSGLSEKLARLADRAQESAATANKDRS
jgi:hypothetical protein